MKLFVLKIVNKYGQIVRFRHLKGGQYLETDFVECKRP